MKKFVKAITLMLVLVMTVSMLAVPAMATTEFEDEFSVDLRGPALPCSCGGLMTTYSTKTVDGVTYWLLRCDTCGATREVRA